MLILPFRRQSELCDLLPAEVNHSRASWDELQDRERRLKPNDPYHALLVPSIHETPVSTSILWLWIMISSLRVVIFPDTEPS